MPLKDFLDYVANHPEETISWEFGGKIGTYEGKMIIIKRTSTNPAIGTYRDLFIQTKGTSHPAICSADKESPFSRAHTIRDNKIVALEAA